MRTRSGGRPREWGIRVDLLPPEGDAHGAVPGDAWSGDDSDRPAHELADSAATPGDRESSHA